MVPPGTKRLFLDYCQEARLHFTPLAIPAQIDRDSERHWRGLAPADRNAIVNDLRNIAPAVLDRNQARTNAVNATRAIEVLLQGEFAGRVDWEQVSRAAPPAKQVYRILARGPQTVISNLRAAFAQTLHHLAVHNDVKLYANNQAQDEVLELQRHNGEAARYNDLSWIPGVAPRPDGRRKTLEAWVPNSKRQRVNGERKQVFNATALTDMQGPSPNWVGGWPLTGGGMSNCSIYVGANAGNSVADRVVIKETWMKRHQYRDATYWDGPLRDTHTCLPYEITCNGALDAAHGIGVDVPGVRSWRVDDPLMRYRIMLEYCGRGTLAGIIAHFREGLGLLHPTPLPEAFLWRVFYSLATVGLAMEKGHTDHNDETPAPNWDEILHRDLKPLNIFLDEPDLNLSGSFETTYPTPKVGDWGFAFKTWPGDVLNPDIFVDGGGTPGFKAPEQTAFVNANDLAPMDRFRLNSKTNVWGVGQILYSLATLTAGHEDNLWIGGMADEMTVPDNIDGVFTGYSMLLRVLIDQCIRFYPDHRPTFPHILGQIRVAIGRGLTRLPALPPGVVDPARSLYTQDVYAIGRAVALLPAIP